MVAFVNFTATRARAGIPGAWPKSKAAPVSPLVAAEKRRPIWARIGDGVLVLFLFTLFLVACAWYYVTGGKDARRELSGNHDEDSRKDV